MKIIVENPSSPGASFTDNTNDVLLRTYYWILKNPGLNLDYKSFRKRLEEEDGQNDNNNRNIHPLLKNCGFINYSAYSPFNVDDFFSKNGLAYIKSLEILKKVSDKNEQYRAVELANEMCGLLIFEGLKNLMKTNDLKYMPTFKLMISYLNEYEKINKDEFALMLFYETKINKFGIKSINEEVKKYRNNEIKLEVEVKVRNDNAPIGDLSKHKFEKISYLTSYNYYTALLSQALLIEKEDRYYYSVVQKNKKKLSELEG